MNTTLRNLLGFALLLAIVLAMACQCFGADMTTAHRTTGFAPLAVHFSAIDRTSSSLATTNITGLTLSHVRNLTTAGTGVLAYTNSTNEITYTAPGDSAGTAVDVSSDIERTKVYSNNGVDFAVIDVVSASLPGTDQSDNVTITSYRDSGVVQPTDTVFTGEPDYAALAYYWDFGDANAMTYQYGTNAPWDSNEDSGAPIAAHVFEEPGTYTVTLKVWNESGTLTTYTQDITVSDQEATATVYYVDATLGSNSNDGLAPTDEGGGVGPLQTWDAAMAKLTADNIVIKFKRGESYSTSSTVVPAYDDITITTYYNANGTDDEAQAKPALTISGSNVLFDVDPVDDFKVCNLDATGGGTVSAGFCNPNPSGGVSSNILILSCDIQAMGGVMGGAVTSAWGCKHQFVVNVVATDIGFGDEIPPAAGGGNGMFMELNEGAVIGTTVNGMARDGEHCCRVQYNEEGLVAHCSFIDPTDTNGCLAWRGTIFGTTNQLSQPCKNQPFSAICYNVLDSFDQGSYPLDIRAATDGQDVRHENLIIQGNYIIGDGAFIVNLDGWDTTFRRNVVVSTNGVIDIDADSLAQAPKGIRVIGNTIIAGGTDDRAVFIDGLTADPTQLTVSNNICVDSWGVWYIQSVSMDELTADYNLGDNLQYSWARASTQFEGSYGRTLAEVQSEFSLELNSLEGTASFVASGSDNYRLNAGSDGIDDGGTANLKYLRFDADGNFVSGGTLDIGAYEYGASSPPDQPSRTFIPGVLIQQP